MDKISKMKSEYMEITAPDSLYAGVGNMIAKRARRRLIVSRAVKSAAMLALVFALSLNMLPDTAKAMMDVPVLGGIVRVFTLGRYASSENGKEIDIVTPQLGGMFDEAAQQELNERFRENAAILIDAAQKSSSKSVFAGYIVKTDNEDILAVDMYVENIEGSAAVTHSFYTIDKKAGEVVSFDSLFKEGSDYVGRIDQYIRDEMERRNAEGKGMFDIGEGGFETIGSQPKFYINDNGSIVICFDEYEVAAGAQGSPEFEIPNDAVKDILK